MATRASGQDLLVGMELGHYRIVEKIGAGGMGDVYRARDEHLTRDVAIKVLPPGTLIEESARKHFHKEALILSQLNHPNVATIHDFDTQQGVDFLVMEYIPGITLTEKVTGGPLPEKEILRLGAQLAEGLSAAHEQGVVHRDLKPGNLRLTGDGRLKILDFGLAKVRRPAKDSTATESLSETQTMAGTLPYMAPEQLLGGEIDARTDIHAAGLVLYEMGTGHRPFAEMERSQLIGAILRRPPRPLTALNPRLSPELDRIIGKCLEKEPENRYQSAKELTIDLRRLLIPGAVKVSEAPVAGRKPWQVLVPAAVILIAGAIAGTFYFRSRQTTTHLTEKDTIVLADFTNNTGDSVFEDTLRTALNVSLRQSPFLNVLSDSEVAETLQQMTRPASTKLTPEVARELCQRAGSKAYLAGSIGSLGSEYVLHLKGVNCQNGDTLAQEQVTAATKEKVLDALGEAASKLRGELGESLATVQKFDVSLTRATTSSLEALKAYSLGRKVFNEKGDLAAIPFLERATELDPNFAMAYASLAAMQSNLYRYDAATPAAEKAFALRDRASERERYRIAGLYYMIVLGDVEKGSQTYRLWGQSYPTDAGPHHNLEVALSVLGRWEEAVAEGREALRFDPASSVYYSNFAADCMALNRLDDAQAAIREARLHGVGADLLRPPMYELAFLRGDDKEMERLGAGSELTGSHWLELQSDTEAYYGRLSRARLYSRRAAEFELRAGSKESAAQRQAFAALREAEFGNRELARLGVVDAVGPATSWRVKVLAALTLARIGDTARAEVLVTDLQKSNPSNTHLKVYWLPTIKAAIGIAQGKSASALAILEEAAPYELGVPRPTSGFNTGTLYPAYVRGQAYLLAHKGGAAVAEFRKLIEHRGIVLNYPLGALAHLGLARGYALSGDTAVARRAYRDFFAIWKDADSNLPLLRQAKAEYAKLQ